MLHHVRVGVDQITDSFGLKDIQLAVEHCAASKLARGGLPGARQDEGSYNSTRHQVTAVRREFYRVLTGERVGRRKKCNERPIQLLLTIEHVAQT